MAVPNAPTDLSGARVLFMLWDNAGTNAAAMFRGFQPTTLNSNGVAHLGVATHENNDTFGANDAVAVIAGVEGTTVRKALVDASGRIIIRPPLAYDAGAVPGFAHQRALGEAALEGEQAAHGAVGTHLQAEAFDATDPLVIIGAVSAGVAKALATNAAGRLLTSENATLSGTGHKDVAVTGTAVALRASTVCRKVRVKADHDNVASLVIGISSVANVVTGDSTTAGFILRPADTIDVDVADVNTLYINGTAADGASYMFWT
jgi:hypothetical protein